MLIITPFHTNFIKSSEYADMVSTKLHINMWLLNVRDR